MIHDNKLKKMLAEGKKPVGTYIKSYDPSTTEVACLSGFDFIIFDNEHTVMSKETMSGLLRATELYNVTGLIRVRENNAAMILQALDAGAYGIQVPNINTAQEVEQAVNRIYYTPKGLRGFANTTRAGGYGLMPIDEYIRKANEELFCICYCETKTAYENLDEILKVDGLDMVFIGPSDLSQAFGVLGNVTHPLVLNAMNDIVRRTKAAGKYAGTVASNGDAAAELYAKGVDMVVLSSDHGMMAAGAKDMLTRLRANITRAQSY
jgi:4-hydroxy-2-oxoheptanedioate aldolase